MEADYEAIGFSWTGLVDSSGKVATVDLVIEEPSATPETVEPTATPAPTQARYQDDTYN